MVTLVRVSAPCVMVICLFVLVAAFDQPPVLAQTGGVTQCGGQSCVFSPQCNGVYPCDPQPPYYCICNGMSCYCKAFG